MIAVPICGRSIIIDNYNRQICIGAKCIKYRTRKQFDIAYEMVMEVARYCEEEVMKKKEVLDAEKKGEGL